MPLGYFRIRKIIPAAVKTQPCATSEEARQRTLWLYRTCLRQVHPIHLHSLNDTQAAEIQALYPLDVPVPQIRRRMREEFEKNRYVKNLDVINAVLMKGTMELEEMLHMWKTHSHVMKYFKVC
jgi:NADH dehydrogenase (ubiquinone) 1 alpha subcomplex subunit 6